MPGLVTRSQTNMTDLQQQIIAILKRERSMNFESLRAELDSSAKDLHGALNELKLMHAIITTRKPMSWSPGGVDRVEFYRLRRVV